MHRRRAAGVLLVALTVGLTTQPAAAASGYSSDKTKPDLSAALAAFNYRWRANGKADLSGTVKDVVTLAWNDRVASWVNQNATSAQRFRALQDAEYRSADGSGYDQSITVADGLGQRLGALYVEGRLTGKLPLTSKLLSNTDGTIGRYVTTGALKKQFGYPRPFLPADPKAAAVPGDSSVCAASRVNASSLASMRKGQPWADAAGNLLITRVPDATDTSGRFSAKPVKLSGDYGSSGLCTGGSFPSGHTTSAYLSGIALATLLPELAPSILARTSEAANNRVVLGVHYPLDVIGGRINGQAGVTQRWVDKKFRDANILTARKELVAYLEKSCDTALAVCIAGDQPYANRPYGASAVPGGSSQAVTDRASALAVYTERLGYGFAARFASSATSVPSKAEYLLVTAFPTLSLKQRRAILAQTEAGAGNPLDTTSRGGVFSKGPGSWQRLNLAAAMSATVRLSADGTVTVIAVGGAPTVVRD